MPADEDLPIDIVTTVGPLDPVVATLRDVLHRSGALRVVAVVPVRVASHAADDHPEAVAAIVDVGRLTPVEVQVGDRLVHLPHAIELDAEPLGFIEARLLPPFEVDAAAGEVVGTIGGLDYVADIARGLAGLLGAGSVAMLTMATTTADAPLSVAARTGEAVVVTIGEETFELPGDDPAGPARA